MSPICVVTTVFTPCEGLRLQGGGEILEDYEGLGARILQLVLQFPAACTAGCSSPHEPAAQDPEEGHRILQQVGRHDGDARAGFRPPNLQPGAEVTRQPIQLRIVSVRSCGEAGRALNFETLLARISRMLPRPS